MLVMALLVAVALAMVIAIAMSGGFSGCGGRRALEVVALVVVMVVMALVVVGALLMLVAPVVSEWWDITVFSLTPSPRPL